MVGDDQRSAIVGQQGEQTGRIVGVGGLGICLPPEPQHGRHLVARRRAQVGGHRDEGRDTTEAEPGDSRCRPERSGPTR